MDSFEKEIILANLKQEIAFVVPISPPIQFTWNSEKFRWIAIYLNKFGKQIGGLTLSGNNEINSFDPEVFLKFQLDPEAAIKKNRKTEKYVQQVNALYSNPRNKKKESSGKLF